MSAPAAGPAGDNPEQRRRDWVGKPRSYLLAWGLPSAALLATLFLEPPIRTVIWSAALAWMGLACLANARRCGRRHCYLTGPFFLILAAAGPVHDLAWLPLGGDRWLWLFAVLALGLPALWVLPERIWGRYAGRQG